MTNVLEFRRKGMGAPVQPVQVASPSPQTRAHPAPRVLVAQPYPMPSPGQWGEQRKARIFRASVAISIACAAIGVAILVNRLMNRPDELLFVWGIGVCGLVFCMFLFLLTGILQDEWWRFFAISTPFIFFVFLCREFPAVFWAVLKEMMVLGEDLVAFVQSIQGITP